MSLSSRDTVATAIRIGDPSPLRAIRAIDGSDGIAIMSRSVSCATPWPEQARVSSSALTPQWRSPS